MARLLVKTARSLDRLMDALATELATAPLPALEPETVIVLNHGMSRWISMGLAKRLGVAAAMDYRFPNEVIDRCFRNAFPDAPVASAFTRDSMTWRIAAVLPKLLTQPGFEVVRRYLSDRGDDRRLLQLSGVLADLFDQYIIFRPEMVIAWDRGRDDGWQSVLWRSLAPEHRGRHRAALLAAFEAADGTIAASGLPSRISIFGISYLPPFHLRAFSLLAQQCDVTFYLQNPCGAYWGDLVSRQRLAELMVNSPIDAPEYYDTGNPLLSFLGTMGQEFHDLLLELGFETEDLDIEASPAQSLLHCLQEDITGLRDSSDKDEVRAIHSADRSLQVHSCHGPLREMEVLYDNLLAMFDEVDRLESRDVVVMIPDIEAYAPYIAAVFGARTGGRPPIPFTIADRSQRHDSPLLRSFVQMLGLGESRFGVNQILELLELQPVLGRFGIDAVEMESIREWVAAGKVAWGLDARHRASLGFLAFEESSWQTALDRLFLGYAMGSEEMVDGIVPLPAAEGQAAVALGKLAQFVATCADAAAALARRQTLKEWADTLHPIAAALFDARAEEWLPLLAALQTLRAAEAESGFDAAVSLPAVRDFLTGQLDRAGGGFGFLTGKVTFCAMLPMRSIPFRVICLAGMNDGVFPRNRRQPGFSLMSGRRRRGDRSLRDEDRYLFLETLLAARERLYISYTGQSDRDNSIIPPSVVVSELLDYVRAGYRTGDQDGSAPQVLVQHRLQPFSEEYFRDGGMSGLFSYAPEYCAALEARRTAAIEPERFISDPLPDDPELLANIDVVELKRFLANPAALFLARRLQIHPHSPTAEADESEPFTVDNLDRYALRQDLVKELLAGQAPEHCFAIARGKGLLPPLHAGEAAFGMLLEECRGFSDRLAPLIGERLEPLAFVFEHGEIRLSGKLKNVTAGTHVAWRCASMKGKDRLGLWVDHLILNTVRPAGYPLTSLLVCTDRTLEFPPLDNADELLADLLELYREGLARPIPFFPQSSWLFLTEGLDKARTCWNGSDHSPYPAESSHPAYRICFRDVDPLDVEFQELSERVYRTILEVGMEEKRGQ